MGPYPGICFRRGNVEITRRPHRPLPRHHQPLHRRIRQLVPRQLRRLQSRTFLREPCVNYRQLPTAGRRCSSSFIFKSRDSIRPLGETPRVFFAATCPWVARFRPTLRRRESSALGRKVSSGEVPWANERRASRRLRPAPWSRQRTTPSGNVPPTLQRHPPRTPTPHPIAFLGPTSTGRKCL